MFIRIAAVPAMNVSDARVFRTQSTIWSAAMCGNALFPKDIFVASQFAWLPDVQLPLTNFQDRLDRLLTVILELPCEVVSYCSYASEHSKHCFCSFLKSRKDFQEHKRLA
jgi:hypothetical protein